MSELETTRQKEFDLETVIKGSDQSHNLAVDTVIGGQRPHSNQEWHCDSGLPVTVLGIQAIF